MTPCSGIGTSKKNAGRSIQRTRRKSGGASIRRAMNDQNTAFWKSVQAAYNEKQLTPKLSHTGPKRSTRESGTASAIPCWLQRLVRHISFMTTSNQKYKYRNPSDSIKYPARPNTSCVIEHPTDKTQLPNRKYPQNNIQPKTTGISWSLAAQNTNKGIHEPSDKQSHHTNQQEESKAPHTPNSVLTKSQPVRFFVFPRPFHEVIFSPAAPPVNLLSKGLRGFSGPPASAQSHRFWSAYQSDKGQSHFVFCRFDMRIRSHSLRAVGSPHWAEVQLQLQGKAQGPHRGRGASARVGHSTPSPPIDA